MSAMVCHRACYRCVHCRQTGADQQAKQGLWSKAGLYFDSYCFQIFECFEIKKASEIIAEVIQPYFVFFQYRFAVLKGIFL